MCDSVSITNLNAKRKERKMTRAQCFAPHQKCTWKEKKNGKNCICCCYCDECNSVCLQLLWNENNWKNERVRERVWCFLLLFDYRRSDVSNLLIDKKEKWENETKSIYCRTKARILNRIHANSGMFNAVNLCKWVKRQAPFSKVVLFLSSFASHNHFLVFKCACMSTGKFNPVAGHDLVLFLVDSAC